MKYINYNETLNINDFYKVAQDGGIYITATFYNPDTEEYFTTCVRDYDYADCSRDKDELYYKSINEEVTKEFYHHFGKLYEGDTVEIYKGRKLPIGAVKTIARFYDYKDCYGRVQTTYVVFTDNTKTSITNIKLI